MEYVIIGIASLVASGLTLFSGFGLGTMLMPVFALFFELEVAIAVTAIVHLLNNLFKLALLGREADKGTVLRFGVPALGAAFFGAWAMTALSNIEPLMQYEWWGRTFQIEPLKLVIALLMMVFAVLEIGPGFAKLSLGRKYLVPGGMLSGFFGGLSGHQGALRSAFLLKSGLTKEAFIATGVVIACMVDVSRLVVYSERFLAVGLRDNLSLVAVAVGAAFLGAFIGRHMMKKVTFRVVQLLVSVMLIVIAIGLGSGLI